MPLVEITRGFLVACGIVVPERVKGLFSWLLGANSRLWQFMGAGAPAVAKLLV